MTNLVVRARAKLHNRDKELKPHFQIFFLIKSINLAPV